jgi:hypothetical protein
LRENNTKTLTVENKEGPEKTSTYCDKYRPVNLSNKETYVKITW